MSLYLESLTDHTAAEPRCWEKGGPVVERLLAGVWVAQPIPTSAIPFGFSLEPVGTHISRTMMLAELRLLLAACPNEAKLKDYYAAVVEDNVLLKPTVTTRRRSIRRLKELYRLDNQVLIFRVLRDLWDYDQLAQPLIALLCAIATDPLLRSTSDLILSLTPGEAVTPQMFETAVEENFHNRYSKSSLASIGRNVASSWQQSGHLIGKLHKIRARAESRPTAVTYALLLGYICGARGDMLFNTVWSRLIDTSLHELQAQTVAAAQQGWLEYRHAGAVTEISFQHLLRDVNRDLL
jgi:hypothetical protein